MATWNYLNTPEVQQYKKDHHYGDGIDVGRIATGVATGGYSEVARAAETAGKKLYGNSLGSTDASKIDEDRQRALDMYHQREAQLANTPPEVRAQEASAPGDVVYHDPGAVERANATLADAAPEVKVGQMAPVQQVQSRDVQAAQAGYDKVGGAQINTSQAQQARGMQSDYLQTLQQRANGQGPSVADASYQGKLADMQRSVLGAAATARGNDRSYARLQAMQQLGDQSRRAAMDSATLKATEAQGALGALGSGLHDVRTTDLGQATTQAQLDQQAALQGQTVGADVSKFNAAATTEAATGSANRDLTGQTTNAGAVNARTMDQAKLQADVDAGNAGRTQQNSQYNATAQTGVSTTNAAAANTRATDTAHQQLGAATTNQTATAGNNQYNATQRQTAQVQTIGARQNDQQILGGQQQTASDAAAGSTKSAIDAAEKDKDRRAKTADAVISGAATLGVGALTKSDRRTKTDISRDSDREVDDALKKIELYQYRYKDPSDGTGVRHGPMAQDLEKDPILRSVVSAGPDGKKVVDTSALALVMAGLTARKLRELDSRRA
jgi:hypothetical protein